MRQLAIVILLIILSISLRAQQADASLSRRADSVAALYSGHSLYQLKALADKLTTPFSADTDKFRAIYTWVCTNIATDYSSYRKSKYKRPNPESDPQKIRMWNQEFTSDVFRTLLTQHKTVCTGYAYLVCEFSRLAGIQCEMVNGYARTANSAQVLTNQPNHTWNAVWLNGSWKLCDPTWSSGRLDATTGEFLAMYDDVYFLVDPNVFANNHYPVDTSWLLIRQKRSLAEFHRQPISYAPAYRFGISELSPMLFTHLVVRGERTEFQFNSTVAIADVSVKVGESQPVSLPYQQTGNHYRTEYVFQTKGTRVVHLLINGQPAITYRVVVE